jgi:hypothetical protein
MAKIMRQGLLVLLSCIAFVQLTDAAPTKFTDVQARDVTVTRDLTVQDDLSVTDDVAVTGDLTASGAVSLSTTAFTGALLPWPRTLAQINALRSGTTGQMVLCSDCTRSKLCVSTGTVTAGAWVVAVATAAYPSVDTLHCE